jgi:hypothetical protein
MSDDLTARQSPCFDFGEGRLLRAGRSLGIDKYVVRLGRKAKLLARLHLLEGIACHLCSDPQGREVAQLVDPFDVGCDRLRSYSLMPAGVRRINGGLNCNVSDRPSPLATSTRSSS